MGKNDFWGRWYEADEIKRLKLVEEWLLPGSGLSIAVAAEVDDDVVRHATASLLNSYFCDLAEYVGDKWGMGL